MHDAYQDSNHPSYKNVAYHLEFLTMRPKSIWLKKFKGQPLPQQNDQQKRILSPFCSLLHSVVVFPQPI